MQIRKVNIQDLEILKEFGKLTFIETFASQNSEEHMNDYLKKQFTVKQVTAELSNPNTEFYFAEHDSKVLGYLKVNIGPAQTEQKGDHALQIERVYVLKEFHGTGIGQKLYEKAIELAREKNLKFVWLGVWEDNPRAIRFYEKNGFEPCGEHIFKLGDDEQRDITMKLMLN